MTTRRWVEPVCYHRIRIDPPWTAGDYRLRPLPRRDQAMTLFRRPTDSIPG